MQPKPPPTSGAMARTWSSPISFIEAMNDRSRCGDWVDDQMVIVSLPGS